MTNIRKKLSYANVMASVAVFAALGGGAFAATQKAAKDTVVSSSIKNGKVKSSDLKDGGVGIGDLAADSVGAAALRDGEVGSAELANGGVSGEDVADDGLTGADLAGDSVTGGDVDEGTLGTVPDASQLGGVTPEQYLSYGSVMPSGITIRGVWGGREYGSGNPMIQDYSFPFAAAQQLNDNQVNFAAGGNSGNIGNDDDPTCTGNVASPTAPAGKVCLYVSADDLLASPDSAEGRGASSARRGFSVRGPSLAAGDVEAHGSWAFTTP